MDTISGLFGGGGGGSGFEPFSERKAQDHYEDLYLREQPRHESSMTHEAIAAAAGFAAMHAYEAHLRATGQPVSHGKMKEIVAAIAAAEVDKLAETKGLDWVDRHRAKKMAEHQAHTLAHQRYGEESSGWEYATAQQGGPAREYDFYGGAPWGAQGCPSSGWYEQRYGGGYGGGGYGGGGGGYGGGGGGYGGGGYGGGGYERGGYGGGGYGGGYAEPGPGYGGGGYGGGYGGGGYAREGGYGGYQGGY